jgi:alkylated DNA repair dioxygenase AlkB
VGQLVTLPFEVFQFHGYVGRRRVVSYGWHYDFEHGKLLRTEPIPAFLHPLRKAAADFAGLPPSALEHVLLTEYALGAAIGWHKDKGAFGQVVGISLLASCAFRLRRQVGARWERLTLRLPPRSVYFLSGPSRTEWEHSIPAVEALRYSVTFRTMG